VIIGAILAMSAIGITTDQDWFALLVVAVQLICLGLGVWAVTNYKWFYVALKTLPRDLL
jgi:hypothetical protein